MFLGVFYLFVRDPPQLAVKSFPKKSDGSKGTAEAEGKIERGDFLLAVNSIRLEGLAFNDAIRVLTTQVRAKAERWVLQPLGSRLESSHLLFEHVTHRKPESNEWMGSTASLIPAGQVPLTFCVCVECTW